MTSAPWPATANESRWGDPEARFWSRVEKTGTCWNWTGAPTAKGYGRLLWRGRYRLAHQVMLELNGQTIPAGLETDHLCRNTRCVNPDHLELVTHKENVHRGDRAPVIVCPQCGGPRELIGSKLRCPPCYREYHRKYERARSQRRKGQRRGRV